MKSKFEKLKVKEIISQEYIGGARECNYSNVSYIDTAQNVKGTNGQFDIIAATNPASGIGNDVYRSGAGGDSPFNQNY